MPSEHDSRTPGTDGFATTRWSVVLSAGRGPSADSRRALEDLCRTYWSPLYAYARRRVGDPGEAQDLTQEFFTELLDKNYVDAATRERGRFRAFLIASFKHFLSKQWRKARARKRGGGRAPIPLDFERADERFRVEPCTRLTAEQLYERQWAVTLLDRILERLRSEIALAGKIELFEELRGFVIGEREGATYSAAATRLGTTEAAARMAAHRMRRRYRELLREEIAQTVGSSEEVDEEIRNLFDALRR